MPARRPRPRDLQTIFMEELGQLFTGLAAAPGTAGGWGQQLGRLSESLGDDVRASLRQLLCAEGSEVRAHLTQTLSQGLTAGVAFLTPKLVAQFGLAPAVATGAATLIFNTLAEGGQDALCAALSKNKTGAKPKPKPRPKPKTKPKAKPKAKPKRPAAKGRRPRRA